MAENSISMTPYHYVGNNPIAYVDPNGLDWFYYKTEGAESASWNWHDGNEYEHTYSVQNDDGTTSSSSVTLTGVEAVAVFDGYFDEQLGSGGNLYGNGAILGTLTVYGPNGANDIQTYDGFTMSSDPSRFGVVENGIHPANYTSAGKTGSLESNWPLNNKGPVPANGGTNPAHPERNPGYLDRVYIHRSNMNGFAGTYEQNGQIHGISEGCLLVCPGSQGNEADWVRFKNQINGATNFQVQINRSVTDGMKGLLRFMYGNNSVTESERRLNPHKYVDYKSF